MNGREICDAKLCYYIYYSSRMSYVYRGGIASCFFSSARITILNGRANCEELQVNPLSRKSVSLEGLAGWGRAGAAPATNALRPVCT